MFSDQVLQYINVALNIYSIVISLIVFVYTIIRKNKSKADKWFIVTLITDILMVLSDTFTWIFKGDTYSFNYIIHPVSMYIYYTCTYLISVFYLFYVVSFLNLDIRKTIKFKIIIITTIFDCLILWTNPFTRFCFSFDQNNIYTRGNLFILSVIPIFIIQYIILVIIHNKNKTATKKERLSLQSVVLVPIILLIVQFFAYGISFTNMGYAMCFILVFINLNLFLEEDVKNKNIEISNKEKQIEELQEHTIISLTNIIDNRDTDTGNHVRRTSELVEILAKQCCQDNLFTDILNDHYIELLKKAAPMHDIGKIVIADSILKKAAKLTDKEYNEMKYHTLAGGEIVKEVLTDFNDPEYIKITSELVLYHHEKFDGTGYPDGLSGNDIPLSARIMAIADVFDALVSSRIYKAPMSYDLAFSIIEKKAGTHFDSTLVKEFLKIKDKAIAINEKYKN